MKARYKYHTQARKDTTLSYKCTYIYIVVLVLLCWKYRRRVENKIIVQYVIPPPFQNRIISPYLCLERKDTTYVYTMIHFGMYCCTEQVRA